MTDFSSIEKLMAGLPIQEQEVLLAQVEEYRTALEREGAQKSFM